MRRFEELAWSETPRGEISLRRRIEPTLKVDVYEVKLGDEFLMSSLFTVAEVELARLALARAKGDELDVVVGGLGLGCTARAALEDSRVRSMVVVDAMAEVIDWHERELLPESARLVRDPRSRLLLDDFFALAASEEGFDPDAPGRTFDAVLLDIDHTPHHLLHPDHAPFYTVDGLRRLRSHVKPDGVFALWSDDPPDAQFCALVEQVFDHVDAHVVSFANFLTGGESSNTVYVAH
ncbi:spermidine synthase [Janibacter cremeus]|uniref:Spermidine synthase n=1 Tax=Janibacter cremeus TaxID=1285192 RepID=A0A852VNE1_9MICO|nr:spermidine synthase [Janibacter cremeus]NYF98522.1 spermidine synthase [Janibacter cremeus]